MAKKRKNVDEDLVWNEEALLDRALEEAQTWDSVDGPIDRWLGFVPGTWELVCNQFAYQDGVSRTVLALKLTLGFTDAECIKWFSPMDRPRVATVIRKLRCDMPRIRAFLKPLVCANGIKINDIRKRCRLRKDRPDY